MNAPQGGDTGEETRKRHIELIPDERPVTVPAPATEPQPA